MSKYTVAHAFGAHAVGDTLDAGALTDTDVVYLLAIGALIAANDTTKPVRRARTVTTESEE